ncbi:MAG: MFS transporter [Dissulfurimicrobium sp.]|uniref:MFS transporter n=1 Tax=Dissulfurimicrobium TaxID=1769732 RepID=UPI001EDBD133|nr:MFS transporter [Dissulfurimicrobium hydrothermale]UKL13526.1 MFS transporter [Dissulfurimicrobium hydrothermale]
MEPARPAEKFQTRHPLWAVLYKYSLFEAADSAWSMIVVSTYFGVFLQKVIGRSGADFGWAVTVGALIVAIISPLLGASADNSRRRQPYLRVFVFGLVICTASLGWARSEPVAISLFILAYICANAAFTFFIAMIPAVADKKNVTAVISMTVGIGYAGSLICLVGLSRLVPTDELAGRVFLPMSLIYLILAYPAMYLAPDFKAGSHSRVDIYAAYGRIRDTFRHARRYRYFFIFLVGDFLYENAVASVITLMGLYSRNVMGFNASELASLFGPAIIVAMLSAWIIFGPLVKAVGPKKAVLIDLMIWFLLFVMILIIRPGMALNLGPFHMDAKLLFRFTVAPLAGMGLAGVWSSSRVLLTALTPADKSGEFWGLYTLSGRTASVLGDATWSLILTIFGEQIFGYKLAAAALMAYVILGAFLISLIPGIRPSSGNFLEKGRIQAA